MSFVHFLCDEDQEEECVKYLTILQEEEYEDDEEVSGYSGPEATSQIDEYPTESHIVPWEPDGFFFTFI